MSVRTASSVKYSFSFLLSFSLVSITLPYNMKLIKIGSLNKKFRHIDKETDVLSFPIWSNVKKIARLKIARSLFQ